MKYIGGEMFLREQYYAFNIYPSIYHYSTFFNRKKNGKFLGLIQILNFDARMSKHIRRIKKQRNKLSLPREINSK